MEGKGSTGEVENSMIIVVGCNVIPSLSPGVIGINGYYHSSRHSSKFSRKRLESLVMGAIVRFTQFVAGGRFR